eukprot:7050290-Pyramimonas_sp.AAC.1
MGAVANAIHTASPRSDPTGADGPTVDPTVADGPAASEPQTRDDLAAEISSSDDEYQVPKATFLIRAV